MIRATLLASITMALVGCGSSPYPTARVTGEVHCNGQPVASVVVFFRPTTNKNGVETGKVGQGLTNESGEFSISTYGTNDGAVVGKNQIIVDAPLPDGVTYKGCDCETHSQKVVEEVEVESGESNHFMINLKPKAKKAPSPKALAEAAEEAKKEAEAEAAEAGAEKARDSADE